MTIGTLSDSAGAYSVAGGFSAQLSLGSQTYAVTLVPDSPGDGNYSLTVNLPGLPPDGPMGTLSVNQSAGGQSNNASTGVSINVMSYNTLTVTPQDAWFAFRDPAGPATVATFSDSLAFGGNQQPSSYSGTLMLGTQSFPVSFAGNSIQADLSGLAPGAYSGTIFASDASAGAQTPQAVNVTIADGPISVAPGYIFATLNVPWTGTLATFTDSNPYAVASDFSSSMGTITGGDGNFVVTTTTPLTFNPTIGMTGPTIDIIDAAGNAYAATDTPTVIPGDVALSADSDPLYLLPFQTFANPIATLADSRGQYSDLYDVTGTVVVAGPNGATASAVFNGPAGAGSISSMLGGFAPGTYTATVTASYFGNTLTAGAGPTTPAPVSFTIIVTHRDPVEGIAYTAYIPLTGAESGAAGPPSIESVSGFPNGYASAYVIQDVLGNYCAVVTGTFPLKNPYEIDVSASDGSSGSESGMVLDAPLEAENTYAINAQLGVAWSGGNLASFIDTDPSGQASDYSASITYHDTTPGGAADVTHTGTITADGFNAYNPLDGQYDAPSFTVSDSQGNTFNLADQYTAIVTVTDLAGSGADAILVMNVAANVPLPTIVSATATNNGGSRNAVTVTGSDPKTLYFTRNSDGSASITASIVAKPDATASYKYTAYELLDWNGTEIADGTLARDHNQISIPALVDDETDNFTLVAGILSNPANPAGSFQPGLSIPLVAGVPIKWMGSYGTGATNFQALDRQFAQAGSTPFEQAAAYAATKIAVGLSSPNAFAVPAITNAGIVLATHNAVGNIPAGSVWRYSDVYVVWGEYSSADGAVSIKNTEKQTVTKESAGVTVAMNTFDSNQTFSEGTDFFTAPLLNPSGGYDRLFVYIDAPSADAVVEPINGGPRLGFVDAIDQTVTATQNDNDIHWHWAVTVDAAADGMPVVYGFRVFSDQ